MLSASARSRSTAELALPCSGGAETRTFSVSPSHPAMQSREEPGTTLIGRCTIELVLARRTPRNSRPYARGPGGCSSSRSLSRCPVFCLKIVKRGHSEYALFAGVSCRPRVGVHRKGVSLFNCNPRRSGPSPLNFLPKFDIYSEKPTLSRYNFLLLLWMMEAETRGTCSGKINQNSKKKQDNKGKSHEIADRDDLAACHVAEAIQYRPSLRHRHASKVRT